jgi:hypothetical protein
MYMYSMHIDNLQFTFKNKYFWRVETENAYYNQHTSHINILNPPTIVILSEYVRIHLHV